jgi:transcriptional regulator
MPENYVSGMAKGVVAFEIPIERIEGKAKLSQNWMPADRSGVISALEKSPDSVDQRLAASMRKFDG